MKAYRKAGIPGDGIGKEVVPEGVRVLEAAVRRFGFALHCVGEVDAVSIQLGLEQVLPVAHDASSPPAIDWALAQPERVAGLVLLNTYYSEMPTLQPPEVQQARDEEAFQAACKLQSVVKLDGRAQLFHLPGPGFVERRAMRAPMQTIE